jgi:hypothetical protein|tara:strand:+ start:445 stop:624 length:180 start_codon:yes stop_codon:yes gene_type:complete
MVFVIILSKVVLLYKERRDIRTIEINNAMTLILLKELVKKIKISEKNNKLKRAALSPEK